MRSDSRRQLEAAMHRLRELPFPHDFERGDEENDLYASLAEYDGHVAGLAVTLLAGGSVSPEFLQPDRALVSELKSRANASSSGLREHLDYAAALDDVLAAARVYLRR